MHFLSFPSLLPPNSPLEPFSHRTTAMDPNEHSTADSQPGYTSYSQPSPSYPANKSKSGPPFPSELRHNQIPRSQTCHDNCTAMKVISRQAMEQVARNAGPFVDAQLPIYTPNAEKVTVSQVSNAKFADPTATAEGQQSRGTSFKDEKVKKS